MKVAGIVVTYNRKSLLLENIEAMLKQTVADCLDIIVIDNNSSDGTFEAIHHYIESNRIQYINTGKNLGGAGGFHYGIKYASEHEYDYIWVMDDDCIPVQNTLEEFLKNDALLNHDYGFLASKVMWIDGSICKMNVPKVSLWKYVSDWKSPQVNIIMSSFVSLFLPIRSVQQYGLPIKEFFIWTDDWEYTRRISREKQSYLINESVVVHKSKSNFGANIALDDIQRLERYSYLYRNDMYLYRREHIEGMLYQVLRLSKHCMDVLLKSKDFKYRRLKYILVNSLRGITFNPKIEFHKEV